MSGNTILLFAIITMIGVYELYTNQLQSTTDDLKIDRIGAIAYPEIHATKPRAATAKDLLDAYKYNDKIDPAMGEVLSYWNCFRYGYDIVNMKVDSIIHVKIDSDYKVLAK